MLGVPPSFYYDNTMKDFLKYIEGWHDNREGQKWFDMYQTSLLLNTLRNQWGKAKHISVEELLGKPATTIDIRDEFETFEDFKENYGKQKKGG